MKKYIYLICVLFLAVSCFDDDTEFGDKELSEISLKAGIEDNYQKEKQEILNISPEVEQTLEGQELKYEWFVNYISVSNEKNLAYTCDTLGNLDCYLKVSNNDDVFYHDFKLKVVSPYEQGLFVLSTNANKSMLSFRRDDKDNASFVKDVFKLNNPEYTLGNRALTMASVDDYIMISTGSPSRIVAIDPQTLEITNVAINPDETMEDIQTITNAGSFIVATMIGKGKVFGYSPSDGDFWTYLRDGIPDDAYFNDRTFYLWSTDGTDTNGQIFYDNTYKQVRWFAPKFSYEDLSNASFPDYDLIDMLPCDKSANVLLFMKDAGSNLKLIRYSAQEDLILAETDVPNTTLTERGINMVHPQKPILYYNKGNKIYRYNYLSSNVPVEDSPFVTVDGTVSKYLFSPDGDKFYVAYQDNSTGLSGCVTCFDADSGDIIWSEKNIAGDIEALLYREPS